MSQVFLQERRSYFLFLALLLTTVTSIFAFPSGILTYAIVGVIWGFVGFLRLSYFLQNGLKTFPKILDLPATILFGASKQDEEEKEFVIKRLDSIDFVIWIIGGFLFMSWIVFCSFNSASISIVLNDQASLTLENGQRQEANFYLMALSLSQYGLAGIVVFLSFTYSHSRTLIKWAFCSLVPIYFFGIIASFIVFPIANPSYFPSFDFLKGAGIGSAQNMALVMPEMIQSSGTSLFRRFIELGWVGAYGLYALFLPAILLLINNIFNQSRATLRPITGLLVLITLLCLDIFPREGFVILYGLKLLGLAVLGLCWGAAGHRR